MKVDFISSDYSSDFCNSVTKKQNTSGCQPSFGGAKSRKFLEMLNNTKNYRKVKATFQDMVDAYTELGYDVVLKRGSHAVVPLTEEYKIPLVIPHKDKYVNPLDIKRLMFVMSGRIEDARKVC